jgi:hypothetical protein
MKPARAIPALAIRGLLFAAGALAAATGVGAPDPGARGPDATVASDPESEPVLAAADLVAPALLAGPGWRVQPRATLHGLQARFWIDSDWGAFPVDSVELLALRVAEMPVVEALHAETVSDALAGAGVEALAAPARSLAALAADPLGAASRVPQGLLRYFGDRARKLGDRARRLGDRLDGALFHDGEPGGALADERPRPPLPWWDKPANELARLLRSQAGHPKARREIAAALGIDPWTGNPLLRARLDQLAWAVASGRMASERLIALASAGTSRTLATIERAASISAEAPPEDLRRRAAATLSRWSADDDLIYALAFRGAFPPPRLALLIERIEALQPAAGHEALLETARLADSELEARFVINALDLLLHDLEHPPQDGRVIPVGALVGYLRSDGEFVLPLAVDRLSWTADVRDWFGHGELARHPRRTLLVAGDISELAARELTRRGWSLRPHQRWPGSPPYRRPGDAA